MKIAVKIVALLLVTVWLVAMYRAKFGQDALAQAAPEVLVLGIDTEHYPFSFTQNDHVVGFDIDLFSAIATRVGKQRIITKLTHDQLIPQLSNGRVHLISQNTPTGLDAEIFLISQSYFEQDTQHFFALSKNNAALLVLLNNTLDEIKEDGTMMELQKKWNLIA